MIRVQTLHIHNDHINILSLAGLEISTSSLAYSAISHYADGCTFLLLNAPCAVDFTHIGPIFNKVVNVFRFNEGLK